MPKLLLILTRLNIGGPALGVTLLNRELARLGYRSTLVAGSCEPGEAEMTYLLQPGDRVIMLPEMSRSPHPARDLAALWRLYRLMRRERPDIVHTHTAKAGALGRLAAALARVPVVVHTFHGHSLTGYFSRPASHLARLAERALALLTTRICVLSPQQLHELAGTLTIAPEHKFCITPLGFDLSLYLALPEPSPPTSCLTVAWIGRLAPIKNIPLLAAIIDQTLRRSSRIRFLVAGDGPERDHLERAAARFGDRCTWLGWQTDIAPILRQSHVLIQTSRNEGTPVSLIQGMAAGRPFVATPAGGVVDMVSGPVLRTAGSCRWYSNGVLAQPDPSAFADALLEFAASPALLAGMSRNARAVAAGRYSVARCLKDLDSLYRSLLAGPVTGIQNIFSAPHPTHSKALTPPAPLQPPPEMTTPPGTIILGD